MRRRCQPSEARWTWWAAAVVVCAVFAALQFGLDAPASGWLLVVLATAAALVTGWEHRRWRALIRDRRVDSRVP